MKQYFCKFSIIVAVLCLTSALKAQNATPEVKVRKNVIKTSLLNPLSVGYERGLGKHLSLSGTYLYLPYMVYGTPEAPTGLFGLGNQSHGMSFEGRYYTSKTKAPLSGFFIGGYYTQRSLALKIQKTVTYDAATNFTVGALLPVTFTNYGAMLGWQKVGMKGFSVGFNMGLGYYVITGLPTIDADTNANVKLLSSLTQHYTGIAPRLGLSFGYAF